jgi:hypothetical protein
MKEWDVFISHASEDKESLAIPLADALRRAGIRVWLDKQEIELGDSIRARIDEGLAKSRFGVVILSEKFLEKNWPKNELNALMAIEESGRKVVLPIWHQIDKDMLIKYSPILADRLAINTDKGMPAVVERIIGVVFSPDSNSPSVLSPTLSRRFIELIESRPEMSELKDFLAYHPSILGGALGIEIAKSLFVVSPQFGSDTPDFCIEDSERTLKGKWYIVILGSPSESLFYKEYATARALKDRVQQLEALFDWIEEHPSAVEQQLASFCYGEGIIIIGRRDQLTSTERDLLKQYMDYLRLPSHSDRYGIQIRTYDWLLDALTRSESRSYPTQ